MNYTHMQLCWRLANDIDIMHKGYWDYLSRLIEEKIEVPDLEPESETTEEAEASVSDPDPQQDLETPAQESDPMQ